MATAAVRYTDRDKHILAALDHCALTVRQLLTLSETFPARFTSERRLQDRLRQLAAAGWVQRWTYATPGPGALYYYTLTAVGYALVHGHKSPPPPRRVLGPIGDALQHHARSLTAFLVQTAVAARRACIELAAFERENARRLQVGEQSLYPDASFQLLPPGGTVFSFFVELDNGSQPVHSAHDLESWERKFRFYDAYQDAVRPERFRALVVTTRRAERLRHLLEAAAAVGRPERSLVCGVTLADYLACGNPVTEPGCRDQRGRPVPLVLLRTTGALPR